MWGIIPAAGAGSRIQPLAFSKELLPVGSRMEETRERPRAVSEHLVERMIAAGADKLLFVISPGKTDILEYFGGRLWGADIAYTVQPSPAGLCDAVFRAAPFVHPDEEVLIGLPDTVWTPLDGFAQLPAGVLSFLLFPVEHPEFFDAVVTRPDRSVVAVEVKRRDPTSHWIWGGIRMPGTVFHELYALWCRPEQGDEYLGTLVNAWLAQGGSAVGVRAGQLYLDVGTLDGYRRAVSLFSVADSSGEASQAQTSPTLAEVSI